jgi:hypothetical protein
MFILDSLDILNEPLHSLSNEWRLNTDRFGLLVSHSRSRLIGGAGDPRQSYKQPGAERNLPRYLHSFDFAISSDCSLLHFRFEAQ